MSRLLDSRQVYKPLGNCCLPDTIDIVFRSLRFCYLKGVYVDSLNCWVAWLRSGLFNFLSFFSSAAWKGLIGLRYLAGSMLLSLWGYTRRRWNKIVDPGNLIGV